MNGHDDELPWILDVVPADCPPDVRDAPHAYRTAWEEHVGPVRPGTGDRERWLEQAARLETGLRLLPDPLVRVAGRLFTPPSGMDPFDLPRYGVASWSPTPDQRLVFLSNADRYATFPMLRRLLGRDVTTAACNHEAETQVAAMLAKHPGEGCVVKFTAQAKYAPVAHIHPDGTFDWDGDEYRAPGRRPFRLWDWLHGAFGWEDEPDAVLIQQRVRMRYEYRVQVIGGKPVCGAGCVERLTPADNHGDPYDPRMEETRGNGHVEHRPDLAGRYAQYAAETARTIAADVTGPYVIDMYLGDDGQPHVIELNAQQNAGLYALDMDTLLTAVRDNPEQFTPAPEAKEFARRLMEGANDHDARDQDHRRNGSI